nr:hypothetical protein [Chloroflexaceae bacterium]
MMLHVEQDKRVLETANQQQTKKAPLARVLIVDDEQYMCDICSRTLRAAGYDVVSTNDASAA